MKKLLHVGCGPKNKTQTTREFAEGDWQEVRLDIDPAAQPDLIGTMTDMSTVESSSVDAVFSSHNIEHLYPHEVPVALAEFIRVLKDEGGFAVVTCPDLRSVCALVVQDKLTETAYMSIAGPITPLDIIFGYRPSLAQGNLYMAHRCGFTQKVLRNTLLKAGFQSVVTMERPSAFDLWALATKRPVTEERIRELANLHFPS